VVVLHYYTCTDDFMANDTVFEVSKNDGLESSS